MIVKTERDEIQNYLKDASNFKGTCNAVYFPESESDIISILKEANKNNISVTIAGNRTGLTGAGVPNDGIVISTEKLNKIIVINKEEKFVQLEPGVILSDLQNELKQHQLFYPPDPTETTCFLGGTVATNASGARTFKYGPTRDYVFGLTILLADGNKLNLERGKNKTKGNQLILLTVKGEKIIINLPEINLSNTKNASGYYCKKDMDAIDLFIGSEGTLGVITNIKLKVLPMPKSKISSVVFFKNELYGLNFIKKARDYSVLNKKEHTDDRINALALEYFDKGSLEFLQEDFVNIPANCQCAVWFEQEINNGNEDLLINKWVELIRSCKGSEENCWFAFNEKEEQKIRDFRHAISEKINEYMAGKKFRKLGTDVAVPHNCFEELYNYAKNITEKEKIKYVNYGHFGNSHMHFNFLPENEKQYEKAKKLYYLISKKAISLNGTVSAEHGIGKSKTHLLVEMLGEKTIGKMFEIKKTLDPNLILGRGNLFNSLLFYK